jgi:hypothetical protein
VGRRVEQLGKYRCLRSELLRRGRINRNIPLADRVKRFKPAME